MADGAGGAQGLGLLEGPVDVRRQVGVQEGGTVVEVHRHRPHEPVEAIERQVH
ncbi:MAG: hypothetical protein U0P45_16745 [Acidimicrobiales bacterium]